MLLWFTVTCFECNHTYCLCTSLVLIFVTSLLKLKPGVCSSKSKGYSANNNQTTLQGLFSKPQWRVQTSSLTSSNCLITSKAQLQTKVTWVTWKLFTGYRLRVRSKLSWDVPAPLVFTSRGSWSLSCAVGSDFVLPPKTDQNMFGVTAPSDQVPTRCWFVRENHKLTSMI